MEEIWRDISGYEGSYQVSNLGGVRSITREDRHGRIWYGRALVLLHDSDGYLVVGLYKDGKRITRKVHRLVASAFIDNPDSLPEINHIDENKENNHADNLEWCTAKYNLTYGSRLDCARGENNYYSKLTASQVEEIRKTYRKGDSEFGQSALGRKYGVAHTTIADIVKGKIWKHLLKEDVNDHKRTA